MATLVITKIKRRLVKKTTTKEAKLSLKAPKLNQCLAQTQLKTIPGSFYSFSFEIAYVGIIIVFMVLHYSVQGFPPPPCFLFLLSSRISQFFPSLQGSLRKIFIKFDSAWFYFSCCIHHFFFDFLMLESNDYRPRLNDDICANAMWTMNAEFFGRFSSCFLSLLRHSFHSRQMILSHPPTLESLRSWRYSS